MPFYFLESDPMPEWQSLTVVAGTSNVICILKDFNSQFSSDLFRMKRQGKQAGWIGG